MTSYLTDHKLIDRVGGQTYLVQLLERTVSAVNIDHLASLVAQKYKRRELIAAGHDLVKLSHDTTTELDSIFESTEKKIFNITSNKQEQFKPKLLRDYRPAIVSRITQGNSNAYPTGLRNLDALIGGLKRKHLIVIAARASMGKTWLACHLADRIATTEKKPVVFFSAEMSGEELTERFLSTYSGIDSHRLAFNDMSDDEIEALTEGLDRLEDPLIIIDDTPGYDLNPTKIRSLLRQIRHERGEFGAIVVDYIQLLGNRSGGNRAQAIGEYSGAFKAIAKEFDVPFIALAQIGRGVESQNNKRPGMADIKDSGDIEQDMDLGLMLYRDEYYNPDTKDRGVMEIIVSKNRNGATGTCKIGFDPTCGKFKDLT